MKVKKYIAPSMPEAMKQVRQELGEAAVILNSREIKSKGFFGLFGKKNIEIIAAIDPEPTRKTNKPDPSIVKPKSNNQTNPSAEIHEYKMDETSTGRGNISLENQYPHPIENVMKKLTLTGLDKASRSHALEKLLSVYYKNEDSITEEDLWSEVVKQFKVELEPYIVDEKIEAKQLFLVGPTGVGKTTTIAKLAASAKMREKKKVAFITLDTYRIAAIEQLKTYAKIMDIPIEVAYNDEDLKQAKEKFEEMDLILIDTAGRNYTKKEYIDQIKEIANFEETDEIICVLSLTTKEEDMEEIFHQFSKLPVSNLIFTKADETSTYGQIYNLWRKQPFNIRNLTVGQDVPDDIIPVDANLLAEMIVGERKW